mmetsp:Transcript_19638/g.33775  ORF Transcript_19638/g.33775 Transcript_19638/m.33775 type:complete len:643 (-) Transcript_19638:84-2012(-)
MTQRQRKTLAIFGQNNNKLKNSNFRSVRSFAASLPKGKNKKSQRPKSDHRDKLQDNHSDGSGKETNREDEPDNNQQDIPSPWNIQECANVLGSLLDSDNACSLTTQQLEAIRYLRSVAASDSDYERQSVPSLRKQVTRRSLYQKNVEKIFKESLESIEKGESKLDVSHTYQGILENFGGRAIFHDSVVRFESGASKKEKMIELRGNPSRKRITLLIHNYKEHPLRPSDFSANGDQPSRYCPAEWKQLATETKTKLVGLLSWENLSKWDFNIVELADYSSDPLLLVGWAILCGPMAQEAMKRSILAEDDANDEAEELVGNMTKSYHYNFHESMNINPKNICNFLREVELRYKHDNPYHNNVHAADVTQTTHAFFQLMEERYIMHIYDRISIFSILLAATFHDIDHPGTNNLFQQNAMTRLSVEYNDVSILENMHSAVGHSLLYNKEGCDVFEGWDQNDKIHARSIMTKGILGTDMSNHFAHSEQFDSLVCQVSKLARGISQDDSRNQRDEPQPILLILAKTLDETDENKECNQLADMLLKFLLHAADISNPAKKEKLSVYWAKCVLSEFFSQGDKEKEMGLPISPLCDRKAVKQHESQIGFIKFVVQPTFELLGKIIPRIQDEVVPTIEKNLEYWLREKKGCP